MHTAGIVKGAHAHDFDRGNAAGERGTRAVMWLTAAMMAVEIAAGWWLNSMALLADGLHMSSHAVAIGLSAFAYAAARRLAGDRRFAFGTWKIEVLAGFASAIFLLGIVVLMIGGSIERLIVPQPIRYEEAIAIAALGLAVNVLSALILGRAHRHGTADHGAHAHQDHPHDNAHDHAHDDAHDHPHDEGRDPHHDLNLRSAYLHVMADAATSVLAIGALGGGWLLGWSWLDPVMGIVGALVVASWARSLVAATSRVLLDREMDHPVVGAIRAAVEAAGRPGAARLADLHVWRVGRNSYSCALSLVTRDRTLDADTVRAWLAPHEEIVHSTIEIHHGDASP
jgi:cation diffusion facilitator family transporter